MCGIAAALGYSADKNEPSLAPLLYQAALALAHRGPRSSGAVAVVGDRQTIHCGSGKVEDALAGFSQVHTQAGLIHTRYATTGSSEAGNIQPIVIDHTPWGPIAIAHNGNLIRIHQLLQIIEQRLGCEFVSQLQQRNVSDTVLLSLLLTSSTKVHLRDALQETVKLIEGAYSLIVMTPKVIYGLRDPHGIWPLTIGFGKDAFWLASETVAFDRVGVTTLRDALPGELVTISDKSLSVMQGFVSPAPQQASCVMEEFYFKKPSSQANGTTTGRNRHALGRQLAAETDIPPKCIIVPVLNSGLDAAEGYASFANRPLVYGLERLTEERSFLQETDEERAAAVEAKHRPVCHLLKDQVVVLVDDTIVRGITLKRIVDMVWKAGASAVHARIASPTISNPCYYGIDTPDRSKLLAHRYDLDGMRRFLGVSSLSFLSLEGTKNVLGPGRCMACITGHYPTESGSGSSLIEQKGTLLCG